MKRSNLILILSLLVAIAPVRSQTLNIAVASNFREAMEEITRSFMAANPKITIRAVYGSSGSLYQQITQHAPFDIFFSADQKYPNELYQLGITYIEPQVYALGQLVLWSANIDLKEGLKKLTMPEVKKIAIANSQVAPYGIAAEECMQYFGVYNLVRGKLVKADNISQAAQFVATGNADVGFLSVSQLNLPAIKNTGYWYLVPEKAYTPIKQAVVCIKREGNKALVDKFIDFMRTAKVKAIILAYGYKTGELN